MRALAFWLGSGRRSDPIKVDDPHPIDRYDDPQHTGSPPRDGYSLPSKGRTFATKMAALGTPIHVTERLLNHVSGGLGGIVAVYNRHTYMDEMREAVETYDRHLIELLNKNAQD
jgi:hypothetical protein